VTSPAQFPVHKWEGHPGEGWLPRVKGQMGILEDHVAFRAHPRQKSTCYLWHFLSMWSGLLASWIAVYCVLPPFMSMTYLHWLDYEVFEDRDCILIGLITGHDTSGQPGYLLNF
jgi:hypothetical protein